MQVDVFTATLANVGVENPLRFAQIVTLFSTTAVGLVMNCIVTVRSSLRLADTFSKCMASKYIPPYYRTADGDIMLDINVTLVRFHANTPVVTRADVSR